MESGAKRTNQRILIVDDNTLIVDIYQEKLTRAGFEAFALKDAEGDFVSKVAAWKPDLILQDINLCEPEEHCVDGFAACKMLRDDPRTKDIPVIFLTNRSEPENIHKAKMLGVSTYIVKAMMTPGEVVEEIKKNLPKA